MATPFSYEPARAFLHELSTAEDAAKYGMADEYRLAEKAAVEALSRKKGLLFKKPLHDLRELASQADDCLMILEHEDYTALGQRLAGTDASEELIEALTDLNIRLEDFFNPDPDDRKDNP